MKAGYFSDLFPDYLAKEAEEQVAAVLFFPQGITLAEVEKELADDPDWGKIKADPESLYRHAQAVLESRIRAKGTVPDGYDSVVECAACGPIFLPSGFPEKVAGCPWCHDRVKGLTIPRPGNG